MNMRQEDFWAQSIGEWDARVAGFLEMHGGGKKDVPLKRDELTKLMEQFPDEEPGEDVSADAPGAPMMHL